MCKIYLFQSSIHFFIPFDDWLILPFYYDLLTFFFGSLSKGFLKISVASKISSFLTIFLEFEPTGLDLKFLLFFFGCC